MKVALSLPDYSGCGHYRAIYPAAAVGDEVEIKFATGLNMQVDDDPDSPNMGAILAIQQLPVDVFVISRPLKRLNAESIPFIQKQGVAVVVDIDDDFTCLDPAHVAYRRHLAKYSPESNGDWLKKACAVADLVTCTTPALARRYGSHGRVAVLPNRIPKQMLGSVAEKPRDGRTIGWAGWVATHPNDLKATRGGVAMACREADARFVNIGPAEGVAEQIGLDDIDAHGGYEFSEYPHAIAELDVGVVPLDDTRFNAAKSSLKGLEMAAVGVPFVASPTEDYRRIADDGIGLLADWKAKKWKQATLELLRNRDEYSEQMRAAVAEHHLIEGHGWRWVEAWEQAIRNRRAKQLVVAG